MSDHERALGVLVHDLRTPLSVASGYLRLVRDGRVPPDTEPSVLLERALEALRAISRLCSDAERWLDTEPGPATARTTASTWVASVARGLSARDLVLHGADTVSQGHVVLAGDARALAEAIVEVVAMAARPAADVTPRILCALDGEGLVFRVACEDGGANGRPFDPWRCPGLQTALACRTIDWAGGRWAAEPPDRVRITVPWRAGDGLAQTSAEDQ